MNFQYFFKLKLHFFLICRLSMIILCITSQIFATFKMDDNNKSVFHKLLNLSDAAESLLQLLRLYSPVQQVDTCSSLDVATDSTLLMLAAKLGRFECCKILLSFCPESITVENSRGFSAFTYACFHGHFPIALLLLEYLSSEMKYQKYLKDGIESAIKGGHSDLAQRINDVLEEDIENCGEDKSAKPSRNPPKNSKSNHSSKMSKDLVLGKGQSIEKEETGPFSKFEASLLYVMVNTVNGADGNQSLIGTVFSCLKDAAKSSSGHDNDLFIGRSGSNDVILGDMSLSKSHAVISYFENKGFLLRDLGSKHGTFVNGKRIGVKDGSSRNNAAPLYLQDGFKIRFGRVYCSVFRKKQEPVLENKFKPNQEAAFQREQQRIMQNASTMLQQKQKDKRKREQERFDCLMRQKQAKIETPVETSEAPSSLHSNSNSTEVFTEDSLGMKLLRKAGYDESAGSAFRTSEVVLQAERDKGRDRTGLGLPTYTAQLDHHHHDDYSNNPSVSATDARRSAMWRKAQERFLSISEGK